MTRKLRGRLTGALLVLCAVFAIAAPAVAQQAYPNRTIRLITPYAAGGTTDVLSRLIGPKLTERWNEAVVVDNRPGGNTIIGTEAVARAAPDGYTLLLASIDHILTPLLQQTPYDAIKSFAPVARVASSGLVLVVHPSLPANDAKELIALAKSRPGQLNFATTGRGGITHLAGALFNRTAGTQIQDIPYKGGGPALSAVIAGEVQMYFSPPIIALPHVKSGRLRTIAITSPSRSSAMPQVPTFMESGLANFQVQSWFGIFAPAATPRPVVDALSMEMARILAMPDVKERFAGLGIEPFVSTPDQFGGWVNAETAKWAEIINAAGIKAEN
jgi:tripartite-type tricarboxylate transporter receptor subunit TctC